ncbi:MAG: T9SS type A sorting domain-containing protein [Candidatus Eisenbacteria bacterium]
MVRIEVLDVQGRLVLALDPAVSQPGRHAVRLAGSGRLAAGVYMVRLIQGGEAATAKLARVR